MVFIGYLCSISKNSNWISWVFVAYKRGALIAFSKYYKLYTIFPFSVHSKKSMPTVNFLELLQTFGNVLAAFVLIFFLCELGEMVTNQYEFLNDQMYQCDWYSFPIGMQRMFVTFMSFTQQPVLIHGYGNTLTQCTREIFKKVIKVQSVAADSFRWIH